MPHGTAGLARNVVAWSPFLSFLAGEDGAALFGSLVVPMLSSTDKAALRAACKGARLSVNKTVTVAHISRPSDHFRGSVWPPFVAFPSLDTSTLSFASPRCVKASSLFLLCQEAASAQLKNLTLVESRHPTTHTASQFGSGAAPLSSHHGHMPQDSNGAGAHHQNSGACSHHHHFASGRGGGGGAAATQPSTVDLTETILAAALSCPALASLAVEKASLLESEAAALARMSGLRSLHLTTNTTAQPLRRPLVQLMLNSLTNLQVLQLSYVRDTTADMALLLPRLPQLSSMTFHYAYWGESGAGERVMAALVKHQHLLQELRLVECCVNDDMLECIVNIRSLHKLHIQDEDAHEDSCPTNKGLVGITRLVNLEQLELFGEELRLDMELLELLAQLPALHHLAMSGLDALRPDDGADGAGQDSEVNELDLDIDLSSAGEEEDDDDDASSAGMDDAISRPRRAPVSSSRSASPASSGEGKPRAQQLRTQEAMSGPQVQQQQAPLQLLPNLQTLRLYGPMSLNLSPPPLALLLPQPKLQKLKLSACASHANVRVLSQQSGLTKLTISHTNVVHLYPQPFMSASHAPVPFEKLSTSILGYHSEVIFGLRHLRILRVKDLPGFLDCHLEDLCSLLRHMPCVTELKLRSLNLLSDIGLAAIAMAPHLQRVKLYALGDGVTEHGIAQAIASLESLQELKVKDCWRVGPSLRDTVAACRVSTSTSAVVVRWGPLECSGRRALTC